MLVMSQQSYILNLVDCTFSFNWNQSVSWEQASLDSLPNQSYALPQVSCRGGLVVHPISHCHVLSVASLPSYQAPLLWDDAIWLHHLAPGSELSFLSTPTLLITFSKVNLLRDDLSDTPGHSNSWPPYFVTWLTSAPWSQDHTMIGPCYYQNLYNFDIPNANISLSRPSLH